MFESPENPTKTFTVEEANAMLPLVRAIAADMVGLARDLYERKQRIERLTSGRDIESTDPYLDELAHEKSQLDQDCERLEEYVDELVQLGVEPKDPAQGLVDFPTMMEERLAYLCWKYDEPEVLYWHEIDAGFAGRKRLTVATLSDDLPGSEGLLD